MNNFLHATCSKLDSQSSKLDSRNSSLETRFSILENFEDREPSFESRLSTLPLSGTVAIREATVKLDYMYIVLSL